LTRNQDNVFEWSDISAHKLLFSEQIHVDPIKGAGLVQSGHYYHLIEYTKMYLVLAPWNCWIFFSFVVNSTHSPVSCISNTLSW
jgi:hypothetical protein